MEYAFWIPLDLLIIAIVFVLFFIWYVDRKIEAKKLLKVEAQKSMWNTCILIQKNIRVNFKYLIYSLNIVKLIMRITVIPYGVLIFYSLYKALTKYKPAYKLNILLSMSTNSASCFSKMLQGFTSFVPPQQNRIASSWAFQCQLIKSHTRTTCFDYPLPSLFREI